MNKVVTTIHTVDGGSREDKEKPLGFGRDFNSRVGRGEMGRRCGIFTGNEIGILSKGGQGPRKQMGI